MMIARTLGITGVLMLMLLVANCSEDDSVCPEPGSYPRVIGTYPVEGAVDVPTDTFLTVIFDKIMDPASISAGSFTLQGPRGLVSAIVSFDGNSTATLTPLVRLAGHSVFTARIDAGVRDVNGQRMNVPYAWPFSTGTTPLLLYPDIEFTIRDNNGDGNPDELVGGGPPGRLLQAGVNGLQVDRAVIEFPLDQIVQDEVIDAFAIITFSATTVQSGIARVESWGFVGNGVGEISDWNNGSLTIAFDDLAIDAGILLALPIVDVINAALDSSATHVGLRIAVTGEPVVEIATSGGITDDDKARISLIY
ncbi:MAG: hypothetical protein GTO29_14200 [Candidatus Latescibacteria bacterium]|nr:hypothetical protein [Candidatus Latescibacterota bacterium]NIO57298.1 hypothetical protein [Candidatus Latescibacterota bacterium]